MRNLALDAAKGELVCQWDDDDYSHPERLETQASHLFRQNADACFLTEHLQYLDHQRTAFWVDWTDGGRHSGLPSWFPGTLMMRRSVGIRYPESGPFARTGEDTMLMQELAANVPVVGLGGNAHLYVYQYHGRNAFSKEHHQQLRVWAADVGTESRDERRIRETLVFAAVPRPTAVTGRDEPASWSRIPAVTHQTAASTDLPDWGRRLRRRSPTCTGRIALRRCGVPGAGRDRAAVSSRLRRLRHQHQRRSLSNRAVYVSGGFLTSTSTFTAHSIRRVSTSYSPKRRSSPRAGSSVRMSTASGGKPCLDRAPHPFWLDVFQEMIRRDVDHRP